MSDLFHSRVLGAVLALTLSGFVSPALAADSDDPMRPPGSSVLQKSSNVVHYYLSSILISPQRRTAIINGKRVGVGDRVGSARVESIQGNEVKLSIAGRTKTLTLLPISIKKPAEASRQ